jgi:alanyl-tRNA synthetase
VLGDHVRQQGSLVSPDYLRFDFSHHGQPSPEELDEVFDLANAVVLTGLDVETVESTRDEAEKMGAIAFFGDKYGDAVRVVRAGSTSLEFCGGTHVDSLGQIGPITLVSEGSIGSNTRRIVAVTGKVAIARAKERERVVRAASDLLRSEPDELVAAVGRTLERQREGERELATLRQQQAEAEAHALAAQAAADGGLVVARRDKVEGKDLQSLAQAVRRHDGVRAVVLVGSPDGTKVAIAAATGGEPDATQLVKSLGKLVGGGGGGSAEVALAGGRDPSQIEAALAEAQRLLSA